MEVEDDAECRRKLDEQRKQMQRELREVGRLSFTSKEVQEKHVESLSCPIPEHQSVQKRSQRIQSIQDKKKICRTKAGQQEKKCGNSERKLCGRKSASHCCCRTESTKTRMADAQMEAELQGLQAGEEEVAMHRRQVKLTPLYKGSKWTWEQHKGRCQEEKKDEGIVKMNKSKAESVSSWCYERQA